MSHPTTHQMPDDHRCYVVLGMHKSGTTLVAKTLHRSGIPMIDHVEHGDYCEAAYFERRSTRAINSAILGDHGMLSARVTTVPSPERIPGRITHAAEAIWDSHSDASWGFKDPRTLLTFNFWRPVLNGVRLIGIYRNPYDVMNHYTRGRPRLPMAATSLHAWRVYNQQLHRIAAAQPDMLLLDYEKLIDDDAEFARFAEFVGRPLVDCREPQLHRHQSPTALAYATSPLYRRLQRRARDDTTASSHLAVQAQADRTDLELARGVVYVATGAEHIAAAHTSVRSLRRHSPALPVTLFTDARAMGAPVSRLFDTVIDIAQPHPRSKVDCLWQSPYERTLYLDCDTEVVADISDMFDILDQFDIALAHAHARFRPATRATWTTDIPQAFPQFNSGVIAFRGTQDTREMLADWSTAYATAGFFKDQVTLRELLWRSDLRIATLPPEYNVRYRKYLWIWRGDEARPRILHVPKAHTIDHLRRRGSGLLHRLNRLKQSFDRSQESRG